MSDQFEKNLFSKFINKTKSFFVKNGNDQSGFQKFIKNPSTIKATAPIFAIVAGLIIGFFVLLFSNPSNCFLGFINLLTAGFKSGDYSKIGIGKVLTEMVPILMTGLSVAFAFKTGLFNIGAPGQFMVAQGITVYVGVYWTAFGIFHWLIAVIMGALAGAIWGAIPGVLKAYFNVNEVISTIMLNYIGMYGVNIFVTAINMVNNNLTSVIANTAYLPSFGLNKILCYKFANAGLIFALIIAIVIYFLLKKTSFGYELLACGKNRDAAKYAGINDKKAIISSMTIAGLLAGLGGAFDMLTGFDQRLTLFSTPSNMGFVGIEVALLALSNPIGCIYSAWFISHITVGGFNMQLKRVGAFAPQISDLIIAIVIYLSAFALLIEIVINKISNYKKNKSMLAKGETVLPNSTNNDLSNGTNNTE